MLIYLVDCRLFIVILIFFNLVFSAFFLTFLYVQKVLCPVNKWVLKQNQSRPTDLEYVSMTSVVMMHVFTPVLSLS